MPIRGTTPGVAVAREELLARVPGFARARGW
jgi:hypothetical protein